MRKFINCHGECRGKPIIDGGAGDAREAARPVEGRAGDRLFPRDQHAAQAENGMLLLRAAR
jgi:hypothetical protein